MASIVTLLGKVESSSSQNVVAVAETSKGGEGGNDDATTTTTKKGTSWTWKGSWAFGTQDPPPARQAVNDMNDNDNNLATPHYHSTSSHTTTSMPFLYTFERVVDASLTPIPSLQPPSLPSKEEPKPQQQQDDSQEVLPANATSLSSLQTPQAAAESKDKTIASKEEETKSETKPEKSNTKHEPAMEEKDVSKEDTPQKQSSVDEKDKEQSTDKSPTDVPVAANPNKNQPQRKEPPTKPKGPTFGDGGFVDARTKHPACPPSGRWKGSFDAALGRKGQDRQTITEYFDIFLYAEPPPDAKWQFSDPTQTHAAPPQAPLPPQHIYIRGAGENQFGVFELLGSFSLVTHAMRLQRLYVFVPTPPPRRGRGRKARSATDHPDGGSASRSTRKRQLSWKRKAALVDETSAAGTATTPTHSQNASVENASASQDGAGSIAMSEESQPPPQQRPTKRQKRKRAMDEGASVATNTTAGTNVSAGAIPMSVETTAMNNNNNNTTIASSAPGKKAASSATGARLGQTPPHGSAVVRLPLEGDDLQARWRAAHYFHYHPAQKESASGGGSTTSASGATNTKTVVYEGELYGGQREGRGVCVYNNDMLYEGEWRRDKEHGYGTLWTGNRKRIIYQGEWEKGRMHGQGKYYYYGGNNDAALRKSKIQSRYEGEFRENLRHGTGMYVLPDGATYSGQWQNGAMSGRGVFTWPDGSVYDGDWKDNKRNGHGVLKASDGFSYEGSWSQNVIDGRGSATYPDGQEYHGMFSGGRREGRGTVKFPNGAVYEGRFRDDAVDGQGTMKIRRAVLIPRDDSVEQQPEGLEGDNNDDDDMEMKTTTTVEEAAATKPSPEEEAEAKKADFMIPISFQSDMGHIHRKAGFTIGGV